MDAAQILRVGACALLPLQTLPSCFDQLGGGGPARSSAPACRGQHLTHLKICRTSSLNEPHGGAEVFSRSTMPCRSSWNTSWRTNPAGAVAAHMCPRPGANPGETAEDYVLFQPRSPRLFLPRRSAPRRPVQCMRLPRASSRPRTTRSPWFRVMTGNHHAERSIVICCTVGLDAVQFRCESNIDNNPPRPPLVGKTTTTGNTNG